jgi:hypothetical protein
MDILKDRSDELVSKIKQLVQDKEFLSQKLKEVDTESSK